VKPARLANALEIKNDALKEASFFDVQRIVRVRTV